MRASGLLSLLPLKSPRSPLILVDGTAIMFRNYFGMPSLTSRVDGPKEIGGVVGFCNSLINLLLPNPPDMQPTIIVVFDTSGPTFRETIFSGYKAQRPAPPEVLSFCRLVANRPRTICR